MDHRFSSRPRTKTTWDRFQLLFLFGTFLALVIVGKLSWLQLVHADEYRRLADEQNSRGVVLPAKRGTIFARDTRTDDLFPLAQNSTTYTVFADPVLIEDGTATAVADALLPILYVPTETPTDDAPADAVRVHPTLPPSSDATLLHAPLTTDSATTSTVASTSTSPTTITSPITLASTPAVVPCVPTATVPPTCVPVVDPRAIFRQKLIDKLTNTNVVRREIRDTTMEERQLVIDSNLSGVTVESETGIIVVNPTLIDAPAVIATKLATILSATYDDIYPLTVRRKVRYVKLAGRIDSERKQNVLALDIRAVGVIPEYRRMYPEHTLASQIVGFLNHDETGAYGIEEAFQKELAGISGIRHTQVDPFNRQITAGDITIREAVDGADVVLTIDRAIQEVTERELAKAVDSQRADSGQAIVMDPRTGAVLALAHYPTFNSNAYGDVYEREMLVGTDHKETHVDATGTVIETVVTDWKTEKGTPITTEWDKAFIIRDSYRYPVFTEKDTDGKEVKFIFKNRNGPAVFTLRALTEPYEPGSVFKSIVMSMAFDAGEVNQATRSPYSQPVDLGEKLASGKSIVIKNALGHYFGRETMSDVIAHSSNIGMTFVVEKLGKAPFYDYLKKYGFGERTDIELDGENGGRFENYTKWTRSEFVTKSFGQGITTNLIQMAAAYSAMANGGLLMKPYIVDRLITPTGGVIRTEPETVRRVISPETSATMTTILIASVQRGFAKVGQVAGYYVAGKTGTSQTYGSHGQALFGVGTTIAGFGGYAPATDPKFVMIVRVDRPRISEWGEGSAGVVFKGVATELLQNYYAIPPQKDL